MGVNQQLCTVPGHILDRMSSMGRGPQSRCALPSAARGPARLATPGALQHPGAAVTPLPCLCARSDLEKSVEKIQKDLAHNHRLIPVQELEEKAVVLKQLGETLTDLKGEEVAMSGAGWQAEPACISLLHPHAWDAPGCPLPLGLHVCSCRCLHLHPQGRFFWVPIGVVCVLQALGCCGSEGCTPRSCCLSLFALLAVQVSPADSA